MTIAELFRNQKEFSPKSSGDKMCLQSSQTTMEKADSFPFGMNEIVTISRDTQIACIQFTNHFPTHTMK